uniref:Uncharacterized protein n=1 Tax=Anguilla anguilla TaxID=7936 RepID=A0A0E9PKD7_ANGAN
MKLECIILKSTTSPQRDRRPNKSSLNANLNSKRTQNHLLKNIIKR